MGGGGCNFPVIEMLIFVPEFFFFWGGGGISVTGCINTSNLDLFYCSVIKRIGTRDGRPLVFFIKHPSLDQCFTA
jgi:hypothetical protein